MNLIDVIILICVVLIVGLIIFFNIRTHLKGESKCSSCPYSKKCTKIACGQTNNEPQNNKEKTE